MGEYVLSVTRVDPYLKASNLSPGDESAFNKERLHDIYLVLEYGYFRSEE